MEPVVEGVEVAEVEVVEVVSAAPCGELNSQEATMDIQNTSPLRYSEDAQDAMRDSIQAMAALIGQLQRREQALEDLVRQQLQLRSGQPRRSTCQSGRAGCTASADATEQPGVDAVSGTGSHTLQQEDG